jgi:WD40-like Beta Propeller Repeat
MLHRSPRTARPRVARVVVLLLALIPVAAVAQVFVYPRRPNKSQVRYYDFDWRHVDILVGPDADTSRADEMKRRTTPATPQPPDKPGPSEAPHVPPVEGKPGDTPSGSTPSVPGTPRLPNPTLQPSKPAAPGDSSSGPTVVPPAGPSPDEAPFSDRTLPEAKDARELLGNRTGGVRLFFYEREREVAERAAALIVHSYVYLVGQFNYVPTETFPYILYSSYQEFLQTNLFPLQEGTLGVTSPVDLKLTLPYFGDHKLFEEVSAHEMAHQFTIQKVRTASEKSGVWGEPLGAMPLWFIEGLAEYYAKRGVDPEADMLVRDLVVNPDPEIGYVLLDFYEDRPWSVLWTYKMGQVRCAFLEETYGRGIIQKILEESPRLLGEVRGRPALDDFKTLLGRLTADEPRQIAVKFEAWLKRRAYSTYLASAQAPPAVEPMEGFDDDYIDALQASPNGHLLALRSIDPETGRSKIVLLDHRAPERDTVVAVDGVPGTESLHPVWGRNFDLTNNEIAWVAESGGTDVIQWQKIEHRAERQNLDTRERLLPPRTPGPTPPVIPSQEAVPRVQHEAVGRRADDLWAVDVRLGAKHSFNIGKKGLIAAYSPSFSPDGKRLAFVGFDFEGNRDVYVLDPDPPEPGGFRLTRLTEDVYAERQISWGRDGVVFNSDATSHGRYNLFRVRPEEPRKVERLTTEARDHLDPKTLPDGRVVFTAFDRGRGNVHEVRDGVVTRRTEITTGFFDLAPGPDGGLWALYHHGGRRKPVLIPSQRLLTLETLPQPEAEPPRAIPERALADAVPYRALAPRNWELGPPFGFIGAGSGGVVGQIVASAADKLRNHALLLNVAILGNISLTDGYLVYLNQEKRITWGTGLFQSLVYRIDQTFPDLAPFFSAERFYGALGSVRYPFDQFVYLQGDLAVGGVSYFLFGQEELMLGDPANNPLRRDLLPEWDAAHRGPRLQTEGTLRFGYDTIRYSAGGPLAGSSFLLEGSSAYQPLDQEVFGTVRLDAERYFPIYGRTHFFLRGGAGTTFGGQLARQFYLSSFDTIRGIPFGREDWLIGRHFLFSTAELQVPLNAIIRLLLLTDIEAIAGIDFGGVGQDPEGVWSRRVLAPVVGFNFGLGPLVIRLHFARPLDINADEMPVAAGDWVTNFSIRILGFEGLLGGRSMGANARHHSGVGATMSGSRAGW